MLSLYLYIYFVTFTWLIVLIEPQIKSFFLRENLIRFTQRFPGNNFNQKINRGNLKLRNFFYINNISDTQTKIHQNTYLLVNVWPCPIIFFSKIYREVSPNCLSVVHEVITFNIFYRQCDQFELQIKVAALVHHKSM